MTSGLMLQRAAGETWRDVVFRLSSKEGLANECLDIFDTKIKAGVDPGVAAWDALNEWDCIPFVAEVG
jgi:hypothetical protein